MMFPSLSGILATLINYVTNQTANALGRSNLNQPPLHHDGTEEKLQVHPVWGKGWTPLHEAAATNDITTLKTLIEAGADINAIDEDSTTPLHTACYNHALSANHNPAIKILLEAGALVESLHKDLFFEIARNGDAESINLFLKHGAKLTWSTSSFWTALHLAAWHNNEETAKALIAAGAPLKSFTINLATPLHMAACSGAVGIVTALLQAGADVNAVCANGGTAIVLAFERGHHEVVARLRAAGAVLPLHLIQHADEQQAEFNDKQSVHTQTVHESVANSIKALHAYYVGKQGRNLQEALKEMKQWIKNLDPSASTDKVNKIICAKNAFARLTAPNYCYIESRTQISLQDALALVWLGINDKDALRIEKERPALTNKDIQERQQTLIKHLYQAQREYNLDKRGNEKVSKNGKIIGGPDQPSCPGGTYNILTSALNGGHDLVKILFVNGKTMSLKAQAFANELFLNLDKEKQQVVAKEWTDQSGMPDPFFNLIKEEAIAKMKEEFKEFQHLPDFDMHFTAAIETLSFMKPSTAVKKAQESLNKTQAKSKTETETPMTGLAGKEEVPDDESATTSSPTQPKPHFQG